MDGDRHPGRLLREHAVQLCDVRHVLVLGVTADPGDELALAGVVHVREARVVELEVGAAELGEPAELFTIGGDDVVPELVEVVVDGLDRGAACAVVEHARRGNGQLRGRGRGLRAEELEVVREDRLPEPDPAAEAEERPAAGRLDPPALVTLDRRVLGGDDLDAVERGAEVVHPRAAPELAVGRGPEADLLLHAHDRRDRLVLERAEVPRVLGAGMQELGRAQQAADVICAKRRLHRFAVHASPGFFGWRYWWPCSGSGASTSPSASRASCQRRTSSSSAA